MYGDGPRNDAMTVHNTLDDLIFVSTVNIPNLSLLTCLEVAYIFRQHAASIYGFVRDVTFVTSKKNVNATSKQGRRLKFGMLTVLTNIRSTNVLW